MNIYRTVITENGKKIDRLTNQKLNQNSQLATEKEKFDYYLKQGFINGNTYLPSLKLNLNNDNFGFYLNRYKRYYDRYFSEKVGIKNNLSLEIQKYYDNGKGSEFKNGKFYSAGSSSRFAVSCFSKNLNGEIVLMNKIKINGKEVDCQISLEKELDIFSESNEIISHPQMDVVINLKTNDIYFIEVKCHEIFDDHKTIELKTKYKDTDFIKSFFSSLAQFTEIQKGKESFITIDNKPLTAKDFGCDLKSFHFDFKQFLCHLMGIIQYQRENDVKIHFYYLFLKNDEYVKQEESSIYEELQLEIENIFSTFSKKFKNIDFGYFYNDRFDTIKNIENKYA